MHSGTPADIGDFADWVRPHLTAMAHLAARLAPTADRDDVVQEALTRAWARRSTYDPARGSPSVWLLAITADQARRARRRFGRLGGQRGDDLTRAGPGASVEENLDLERALARLSRRQRLAVDCVYFAGLTVAETAAVMRCAEGTVKSTLFDARARLRDLLEVSE